MVLYGHDPVKGYLFVWEKEFKFAGRVNPPSGNSFLIQNRVLDSLRGAYFLSGNRKPVKVIWLSKDGSFPFWCCLGEEGICCAVIDNFVVHPTELIIVCGPSVADSYLVSVVCNHFPNNPLYVCPVVEELPSFGFLANELIKQGKEYPRRISFSNPVTGDIEGSYCYPYEESMENDAFGKMAFSVSKDVVVYNEMFTGLGLSPFYGRGLSNKPISPETVYILNEDIVDDLLPLVPISLKNYAAKTVPVDVVVPDDFRRKTDCQGKRARIFVANDSLFGVGVFMKFYGALTKLGYVCSGEISEGFQGSLSVYRYNKMYEVSSGYHKEILCPLSKNCIQLPMSQTKSE
jgi:hypothetical protein